MTTDVLHPAVRRLTLCGALAIVALAGAVAVAQETAEGEAPTSGFRAELLMDLARLERQVLSLAEAVPAEGYGWRPAAGVRSVSEAYMHLAAANHQILQALGVEAPEGLDEMEKITDKERVIEALRRSFESVRQAVMETPDDDLEAKVDFFGQQWSKRAVFYLSSTHMHEHLGQSIAYARSIGVVPPWTQEQQGTSGEGGG